MTRHRHADEPRPRSVIATPGVVAAGHQDTVDAAITLLEAGGNAYDATLAAGFAAAVAEPCLSSLGGGGFLLARPAMGEPVLFDFFVDTPGRGRERQEPAPPLTPVTLTFGGAQQVFHVGDASIASPGCLAGYLHVHRRLGRAPLAEVVAPARRLAEAGAVLGADQASVVRLLEPIFSLTAEARELFVPPTRPFADDDRVQNPALAAFLAAVADGEVTGFGDPDLAREIGAQSAAHGGVLTAEDLRTYRVHEHDPLALAYGDATILTNPEPSYGGRLITRALRLLEREGLAGTPGSGARLSQLAHVLAEVSAGHAGGDGGVRTARGTTHVSVADAAGNLASMTTSNGSGSGITLGATGVLANNIMGETDLHPEGFHRAPAGMRVGSMMAPTVLERAGRPAVALGSGGSERIRSALTQVLVALVDDGSSLEEAVMAPRIHWDGEHVQVEPGFDEAAVDVLAEAWPVNRWEVSDLYFGGVHAVATDGSRVGDPRRGGRTGIVTRGARHRGPGVAP
ncbi:MAG: gamma-glutamyltransferase [Nitriliruptoraceae bacterium]